jgi:hypothetical protein
VAAKERPIPHTIPTFMCQQGHHKTPHNLDPLNSLKNKKETRTKNSAEKEGADSNATA